MNKEDFKQAIETLKKTSQKRNFKQSIDLVINLKDLDLKKPEHQVDLWIQLPKDKGRGIKTCAIVGPELLSQAKENCDFVIKKEDFPKYDKKEVRKLARKYNFFIAQVNLMADVAKVFGRVLGPRGKMPNPKAGCVIPGNANLKPLIEKLKKTVKASAKIQPSVKVIVGKEDSPTEEILENVMTVYDAVIHQLPNEDKNVKNVLLKLTMGSPVVVGGKQKKQLAAEAKNG